MNLGCIAPGVIRTLRYFRAGSVISDVLDEVYFSANEKGGLTFLFELNYNTNTLSFTPAITREEDLFSYKSFTTQERTDRTIVDGSDNKIPGRLVKSGRDLVIERFEAGTHTYTIPFDPDLALVEQLYLHLQDQKIIGQLTDPFLRTLFAKMDKYLDINENACALLDQLDEVLDEAE
jgi:hypothetical protein